MNLRPVTKADYVFNGCGQLVPPPGMAFVDLPYVISLECIVPDVSEGELPAAGKVVRGTNQSLTTFECVGMSISSRSDLPSFQIRWADGRYINQQRTTVGGAPPLPMGRNTRMMAFDEPRRLAPGADVAIETSAGTSGSVRVEFHGWVRWLVMPAEAKGCGMNTGCLVGYPLPAGSGGSNAVIDALDGIRAEPRYKCDAVGQNLMAIEAQLGNQGYSAQYCIFQSPTVTLGYGQGLYNQVVSVPFPGKMKLMGVRVRAVWSSDWDPSITSDIQWGVTLPTGYSLTNSDLVSGKAVGTLWLLPTAPVKYQDRITFDVFNLTSAIATDGSVDVFMEFICRRDDN